MKILVTGANGFIGTQIIEHATRGGHTVVSGVRQNSRVDHLKNFPTHILPISYHNIELLENQLSELKIQFGSFQLIIHNAALTKSTHAANLFETNHHLAIRFARAVQKCGLLSDTGKFVFVSSLAARGPDGFYQPVTSYGKSKLLAEHELLGMSLPLVLVRPTAVYGPGDAEFLKLFKVIKWGIAPLLAPASQKLSFVYVKDLARLLIDHTLHLPVQTTLTVTDGHTYSPTLFYSEVGKSIGRNPLSIRIPGPLTLAYAHLNALVSRLTRHNPTLNPEKMKELLSDWTLSDKDNRPEGFYFTSLKDGLAETASHYKTLGLL